MVACSIIVFYLFNYYFKKPFIFFSFYFSSSKPQIRTRLQRLRKEEHQYCWRSDYKRNFNYKIFNTHLNSQICGWVRINWHQTVIISGIYIYKLYISIINYTHAHTWPYCIQLAFFCSFNWSILVLTLLYICIWNMRYYWGIEIVDI